MGLREQQQEHSSEIKKLLGVPEDEPIFIFRAQDKCSVDALNAYKDIVHGKTLIGDESKEWVTDLSSNINAFLNWQRANPDKVKVPD